MVTIAGKVAASAGRPQTKSHAPWRKVFARAESKMILELIARKLMMTSPRSAVAFEASRDITRLSQRTSATGCVLASWRLRVVQKLGRHSSLRGRQHEPEALAVTNRISPKDLCNNIKALDVFMGIDNTVPASYPPVRSINLPARPAT